MADKRTYGRHLPLYPTEREIAEAVLGPSRAAEWPTIASIEERHGLPRIDTIFGGRYWPAVKAYFDRRHGLRRDDVPATSRGKEIWDGGPSRARSPAARPCD